MFSDNLQLALTSYGMSEQAFISLLRDEIYLSKEKNICRKQINTKLSAKYYSYKNNR